MLFQGGGHAQLDAGSPSTPSSQADIQARCNAHTHIPMNIDQRKWRKAEGKETAEQRKGGQEEKWEVRGTVKRRDNNGRERGEGVTLQAVAKNLPTFTANDAWNTLSETWCPEPIAAKYLIWLAGSH